MRLQNRKLPNSNRAKAMRFARRSTGSAKYWAMVLELVETGLEARRNEERQWLLNIAFIKGNQYAYFDSGTHTLIKIKRKPGKMILIDNQILPRWKRQVTDLIKNEPVTSAVPATGDEDDIQAAKLGSRVLRAFWRSDNLDNKLGELGAWMFATGNGYLGDRWNPKKGPKVFDKAAGCYVYEGDAECNVWTPFEILVPAYGMGSCELSDFPWLIAEKWRPLEVINFSYGSKGKKVTAEKYDGSVLEMRHLSGGVPAENTSRVEGAFVRDIYIKPNSEYPKGLFLVMANGVLLDKQDYPYDDYPFEHFKEIQLPGKFFGECTTTNALPLQKTWNQGISSLAEFNKQMAKGKILSPRQAKMQVRPDDSHGQIIEYSPVAGLKPEQMTLKSLPGTIDRSLMMIRASFEDLYSQHAVSRGTNQSDIRSGEMVALLREQDAHGGIPAHARFERGLERVMQRILRRIKVGYRSQRLLKISGREGEFEVIPFKGADLKGTTDVVVKKQSSLPESRTERNADTLRRAEMGLYGPLADERVRRQVLSDLQDAAADSLFSVTRLDESVADWENNALMKGAKIRVNDYDDHGVHRHNHGQFRKRMAYQQLKLSNPQEFMRLELAFAQHDWQHQQFEQAAMQRMMAQQAAMGAR
jgi:hypothetical protein